MCLGTLLELLAFGAAGVTTFRDRGRLRASRRGQDWLATSRNRASLQVNDVALVVGLLLRRGLGILRSGDEMPPKKQTEDEDMNYRYVAGCCYRWDQQVGCATVKMDLQERRVGPLG